MQTLAKRIPLKTILGRRNMPWMTNQVKLLIKQSKRSYNVWKNITNRIFCLIKKTSSRRYDRLSREHTLNTSAIYLTATLDILPSGSGAM